MSKTNKLKNKCRTCLNGSKGLQLLTKIVTEEKDETKSYGELLKDLTHIDIMDKKFNDMPQTICGGCVRKLKAAYTFVQQALEVNDKFRSMLNETSSVNEDKSIDWLQEAQIDIQNGLMIKLEVEETAENNKQELTKIDLDIRLELPEDGNGVLNASIDNLSGAKEVDIKAARTHKDVLEATPKQNQTMSEDEDDYDADDILDKDFPKPDDGLTDSDIESSNDSKWAKDTAKTKDNKYKAKTPVQKIRDKYVDDNIPTPCDKCDSVFPNSRLLGRHKRYTHIPEELKVQCPYCTAKYSSRFNMNTHMRTHHKDKPIEKHIKQIKFPRQFACEHCDGTYTRKYYLMAHMKLKHNPDSAYKKPDRVILPKKRFLCPLCGSKFDSQSGLDAHIRRHTGEKPFKCDLCERTFCRPCDVQVHRLSHTGEKPFKCTICEKPFTTSYKLKIHARTHTNERPYKCEQCEKAFKHLKNLKTHKRKHTGERPYTCGVCQRTFIEKKLLKMHQTKKHFEIIDQVVSC